MAISLNVKGRRCECGRKLIDSECQQCQLYLSMEPSGPWWDIDHYLMGEEEE